jgi:hypothetical protein
MSNSPPMQELPELGIFRQPEDYSLNPHIGHRHHLCSMVRRGDHTLEQIKDLINDPKFMCKRCGRAANDSANLCEPVPLE